MDAVELEKYEYQLSQVSPSTSTPSRGCINSPTHSQVKLALAKDPTNTEYINLKEELSSLVDLTKELLASSAPAPSHDPTPSTSKPSSSRPSASSSSSKPPPSAPAPAVHHSLKLGDECQARYSGDQKFYPARITSVGGSDENRVYSVIFHGYDSTEIVSYNDVKPLTDSKKRQLEVTAEEMEKERKRKKNEKKLDTKQAKTLEQGQKQKSWQSFAKKSTKKGVVIPGISGGSMFRSPDDLNPNAKGVISTLLHPSPSPLHLSPSFFPENVPSQVRSLISRDAFSREEKTRFNVAIQLYTHIFLSHSLSLLLLPPAFLLPPAQINLTDQKRLSPFVTVGVVGSGKGMKPNAERKRTTFREAGDEA